MSITEYNKVGTNGFKYYENFLNENESNELLDFCNGLKFVEYPYRGKTLTRSPKIEFKINENIGVYRFGQEKRAYSLVNAYMPSILENVLEKINDTDINYKLYLVPSCG